ncbi:G-protein coupled receptor 55-like [Coregonus clupeaformis]|uniref:G-protein coupled receptor 55-like n=1 Tax=Coregonus clupeaformis TaxID=59861 RepID=UPI001BE0C349|nr:G-protein coupled receptor 55-like [Coregonus clupeaformis]
MMSNHSHGPHHCNTNMLEEVRLFQRVVYSPVFLLGLVLNLSALRVFYCKRDSWTDTHIYMFNLAVADCALITFLPFRIYHTFFNLDSPGLCVVLVLIHFTNMYASIFTVMAISIQRFIAIQFPFHSRRMGSKKQVAVVVCVMIWVTIVVLCVIFREHNRPEYRQACFERHRPFPLGYILTLEILGYVVPFLTMLLCSLQTICTLLAKKDMHSNEDNRKSIRIISANLVVFFICYTPIHIAFFMKFYVASKVPLDCQQYNLMHNFYHVSEGIATTNCCLDAIGYFFLVKEFRKELIPGRSVQRANRDSPERIALSRTG